MLSYIVLGAKVSPGELVTGKGITYPTINIYVSPKYKTVLENIMMVSVLLQVHCMSNNASGKKLVILVPLISPFIQFLLLKTCKVS